MALELPGSPAGRALLYSALALDVCLDTATALLLYTVMQARSLWPSRCDNTDRAKPPLNGAAMAPRQTTVDDATTNGASATPEAPPSDSRSFEIPRPAFLSAQVHVVGVAPLIMHKWSEKAIKTLEDSQTGKAKAPRTAKQPKTEAYAAAYIVPGKEKAKDAPGKFYFPAEAFKHAFLYGLNQLNDTKKFPKTRATGWVFIEANPILDFESIDMRTDVGRDPVQMVYRLQFNGWSASVDITYNSNSISIEQIAALFDLGGVGGIGEWRPSAPKNKSGNYGRFTVKGVTT